MKLWSISNVSKRNWILLAVALLVLVLIVHQFAGSRRSSKSKVPRKKCYQCVRALWGCKVQECPVASSPHEYACTTTIYKDGNMRKKCEKASVMDQLLQGGDMCIHLPVHEDYLRRLFSLQYEDQGSFWFWIWGPSKEQWIRESLRNFKPSEGDPGGIDLKDNVTICSCCGDSCNSHEYDGILLGRNGNGSGSKGERCLRGKKGEDKGHFGLVVRLALGVLVFGYLVFRKCRNAAIAKRKSPVVSEM